jgi:hypothetical protein
MPQKKRKSDKAPSQKNAKQPRTNECTTAEQARRTDECNNVAKRDTGTTVVARKPPRNRSGQSSQDNKAATAQPTASRTRNGREFHRAGAVAAWQTVAALMFEFELGIKAFPGKTINFASTFPVSRIAGLPAQTFCISHLAL